MALLSNIIGRGTLAARPAAGTAGALYYATDGPALYRDNGTTWDALTLASSGLTVEEADGSPTLAGATKLVLPNGSLSVAGTVATFTGGNPAGLTGATAATRYAGGTASGSPTSGTFATGDFVIDQTGKVWICTAPGTPGTWAQAGGAGGGGGLYSAYVLVRDEKAQGTNGGTFTNGAWRTRDLTNKRQDTAAIGTLATNQLTLPAGTYRCAILAPAYRVDTHQARLRDVTNGVTLVPGSVGYSVSAGDYASSVSFVNGRFTLAAACALEVQHICYSSRTTTGFGSATTLDVEIYTIAEFWKE